MRTLVRVLAIGFSAVIVLLVAAALIGVNNARSNAANAGNLVYDQLVVARLLDDVEREQEVLNTIFYRLTRTPEIVDSVAQPVGPVCQPPSRFRGSSDQS